ncbi:FMN-dependent NADH-azoreductase [Sphingosinicella soli]|uniref:FMN dependent NADH:quinone oxidoreductase n=1 Tax=Sphingosinicella soli TaxID=333708 RepID=A0A7W7B3J3_9SPHN|nr:FMN-dependent NADH-azoreductase [Sphingosinicella soli]
MTRRLIHINASPRGNRSRSAMVARHLLERLDDVAVETLDLDTVDLPALAGETIEGRYALLAGEDVAGEIAADWDRIRDMAAHFLAFDGWLISTPAWNFGVPYRLKHYIDVITQPGMAFSADANGNVIGHAAHGFAIIVAAGALDTRPEGPMASLDHQAAYLQQWLGFIGVGDVHTIRVMPTFGSEDVVEAAMRQAYVEAGSLTERLSRAARV